MERLKVSNRVKDIKISLVSFKEDDDKVILLSSEKISELTIKYSYNKTFVDGYMLYQDNLGVFNFLPNISDNLWLKTDITDCLNINSITYYKITNYKRVANNTAINLYLEFIDEFSFYANTLYESTAYENKSMFEILSEKVTNISKICKSFKCKELRCDDKDEYKKHEIFLSAGNKSIFQWLNQRSYIDDFVFLNRRTDLKLSKSENLWKNAEEFKATLTQSVNTEGPFNIQKYGMSNSVLEYASLQTNLYIDIDFSNSNKLITDANNLLLSAKNFNDNEITPLQFGGYSNSFNNKKLNKIYNQKMLEAQQVNVELNVGSFVYEIGTRINLYIPSTLSQQEGKSMSGMSGQYFIAAIEDNIVNGYFSQKIALIRPGERKANE